ncbi:MAG TPA: hypothetical protein VF680_11725 [Allosphingosinicella sp.]|jgi:hypothetical protein
MFDAGMIAIGAATAASCIAAPAAFARAFSASSELVRLQRSPIGEALDAAYGGVRAEPLPEDMQAMIAQLD